MNVQVGQKELVQYTSWSHANAIVEVINHRLIKEGRNDKRKYELKKKNMFINFVTNNRKNCSKQVKR